MMSSPIPIFCRNVCPIKFNRHTFLFLRINRGNVHYLAREDCGHIAPSDVIIKIMMYSIIGILMYVITPLVVCTACLIVTNKMTKGRCGQIEYAVIMIVVNILQISISYYPVIALFGIYSAPFILLLLLCINIHLSTKRYNDAVIGEDENGKPLIYFAPVSNIVLVFGCFILPYGFLRMDEPRIFYLVLLILCNIIPAIALCVKESDINIKPNDIPVNYHGFLRKLYDENVVNIINISDNIININNFEYSVKHEQNKYIITAYRDIDKEHLLTKYLKEKGIHQLGFHYHNACFELTDDEYVNMIAEIKTYKNIIIIDYPFIVINNVNIFIRNNGIKYCVVLSKTDEEKLNNEIDKLKNISKKKENKEYVCYEGLNRDSIIWWIQNCA